MADFPYHSRTARRRRSALPDTVKLTFEDQGPLQLMLDAVARSGGQAQLLERETGVTVHVRGHEVTLEGDRDGLVERLLRQLYALAQNGAPMDPADRRGRSRCCAKTPRPSCASCSRTPSSSAPTARPSCRGA
ncbi:MAG: hypothetical protein U0168_24770 [Nannocystaceae bacterium]